MILCSHSGGYGETRFVGYNAVKLETIFTSETAVYFQRTTWSYISENRTLCLPNLISYFFGECHFDMLLTPKY
jgi:hypothetical protein